jgi:hypothetical protein
VLKLARGGDPFEQPQPGSRRTVYLGGIGLAAAGAVGAIAWRRR